MDEVQKYLFDLNDYIIIPNAINKKKVDELNTIINNQNLPRPGLLTDEARFGGSGSDYDNTAGFLDWDKNYYLNLLITIEEIRFSNKI